MKRYLGLILAMVCLTVVAVLPSNAQTVDATQRTWWAEYYNNTNLTGWKIVERHEAAIDFDWQFGSAEWGKLNPDNFSARFTRVLTVEEETSYRATLTADDGARVFVNDELLIDRWNATPQESLSAEITLEPGDHRLRVEYFDYVGTALLIFDFEPIRGTNVDTWVGEYFNSSTTFGYPDATRRTRSINFDWGEDSPDPRINTDYWGARWTRLIDVETRSTYRFLASADDGMRIWVGDELIIDGWYEPPWRTISADIDLEPGKHRVKVEYYDSIGYAYINVDYYILRSTDNRQQSGPLEVITYKGPVGATQGRIYQVPEEFYALRVNQGVPRSLYRTNVGAQDGRYIYSTYAERSNSGRMQRGVEIRDTWSQNQVAGRYPMLSDQRVTGLAVRGGYLYISWTYEDRAPYRSCDGAVDIVNVQDPAAADEVGQIYGQGYPHSVYIHNRVLYTVWACTTGLDEDFNSRIDFYDLSPTSPNWLSSDHMPRGTEFIPWAMPIAKFGDYLFVPYDRDKWIVYSLPVVRQ